MPATACSNIPIGRFAEKAVTLCWNDVINNSAIAATAAPAKADALEKLLLKLHWNILSVTGDDLCAA